MIPFTPRQSNVTKHTQGCGIAMPDSYTEPAGQVDFPS